MRKQQTIVKGLGSVWRLLGVTGSFFVCLLLTTQLAVAGPQQNDVRDAAGSFLELLDAGSYQQAWWEGSDLLHLTTDVDQWAEQMRARRDLFGEFVERSLKNVVSRNSLPGLPDGDYAIVLYDCRYEHKQKGLEMMTLGKDAYGAWKVVSYHLR